MQLRVTAGEVSQLRCAEGYRRGDAQAPEYLALRGDCLARCFKFGDDTQSAHWMDAQPRSEHAHPLSSYHPVGDPGDGVIFAAGHQLNNRGDAEGVACHNAW